MKQQKTIVYVGDFDLRNENVQAHLVKNNAAILRSLGYEVAFCGINREKSSFAAVEALSPVAVEGAYLELPYTLSTKGLTQRGEVAKRLLSWLDKLSASSSVAAVISYQAPTYAGILKKLALWCGKTGAKYLVNCADLPIFDSQPLLRRLVMKNNWHRMHRINQDHADGVVAVSKKILEFYHKDGRPGVIVPPLFNDWVSAEEKSGDTASFLYAGTPFVTLDRAVEPAGMKDRLDKVVDLFLALEEQGIPFRFVIVGLSQEVYTTCVPRHKEALGRCESIRFLGRRPHKETLGMLAASDYMINYRDANLMTEAGLSTKVVESVSVGTPVVTNPIGDTFSYLEEGLSAFALTGEKEHDSALLADLCQRSASERREQKRRCREEKIFSLERYASVWEAFFKQVGLVR